MKKKIGFYLGCLALCLMTYTGYSAEISKSTLRLEANVAHLGKVIDKPTDVKIEILKQTKQSTPVWEQTYKNVEFSQGNFAIDLGQDSQNPITPSLFDSAKVWVKMTINGDTTIITVNTVPKSILADTASSIEWDAIQNKPSFVVTDNAVVLQQLVTSINAMSVTTNQINKAMLTSLQSLPALSNQVTYLSASTQNAIEAAISTTNQINSAMLTSLQSLPALSNQVTYLSASTQNAIEAAIATTNIITTTLITNTNKIPALETSLTSVTATANLFKKINNNIAVFSSNPNLKSFVINATTTPNDDTNVSKTVKDIRLYVKGEIRIEATSNATAGKISFGVQNSTFQSREAFIERIATTTAGVSELHMHAYNRLFLTTGTNKNNLGTYRANTSAAGVFINNFSTANVSKLGKPLPSEARPLTFSKPINDDAYAITMQHVDPDNSSMPQPKGLLRLSLISETGSSSGRDYLAFSGSNDELVGSISGHEATVMGIAQAGVKLESAGADYAEYLARINPEETIQAGDIVGVIDGKITKKTEGAQRVMVVSTMPLVVGNSKGSLNKNLYHPVAFVGQVPVSVRGLVKPGDYILPSGKNDGTGIAVSKDALTVDQLSQIIGQAWSGSSNASITQINVAITPMDRPSQLLKKLEAEIQNLKSQKVDVQDFEALKVELAALKAKLNR